mmetsp:Transcript_21803/g.39753  ORF Transcript_21803/g.39753 Transcript_21803/m.39753 type:complete len:291 (-) Transcript_21803:39-911(-)|eukprot:CAMPEP_0204903784 /NCGR_PEP_ID=MMETSP1397-20131031/4479_1 /ASSEMBLY_ACC=CAM_ASM_000891 /TAXON_ID=49980 /ORGANISM="Climacostomum Climacostomum virens, Strain Stock W-24" /LENGTH=290 /DNA_ID=CAMNT_0052072487 /DNA_START=1166 /DNA_END=2038 /DNA_ORIENTATION=+
MDLAKLRSELKNLTADLEDTGALMKLQHILTNTEVAALAFRDPFCKKIIDFIKVQLSKHIFKANLYQFINVTEHAVSEGKQICAKSIHDISGNFLWCQSSCTNLYNTPLDKLMQINVFDLMARESVKRLNLKYGGELLSDRMPKVISFYLKDQETRLTARCSETIYTCEGVNRFGILLETRKSRQNAVPKELNSTMTDDIFKSPKSPAFPASSSVDIEFSPQFTLPLKRRSSFRRASPQYSPPLIKQEYGFSPNMSFNEGLEFSISPYLKQTPELSMKYNGVPNVSEFKG